MIESLKIGCRRYRVETEDRLEAMSEGRDGDIRNSLGVVRIADRLPPDKHAEVLVHEVLHALIDDAAIDWPHEDEESFVRRFAPRLTAFLADNPDAVGELVAMLTEGGP